METKRQNQKGKILKKGPHTSIIPDIISATYPLHCSFKVFKERHSNGKKINAKGRSAFLVVSLFLSLFERLNKSSPRWAWFFREVSSVTVSYNLDVLSHIFVHGNHLGEYTKNFQPENPERVRWNGIKKSG